MKVRLGDWGSIAGKDWVRLKLNVQLPGFTANRMVDDLTSDTHRRGM